MKYHEIKTSKSLKLTFFIFSPVFISVFFCSINRKKNWRDFKNVSLMIWIFFFIFHSDLKLKLKLFHNFFQILLLFLTFERLQIKLLKEQINEIYSFLRTNERQIFLYSFAAVLVAQNIISLNFQICNRLCVTDHFEKFTKLAFNKYLDWTIRIWYLWK